MKPLGIAVLVAIGLMTLGRVWRQAKAQGIPPAFTALLLVSGAICLAIACLALAKAGIVPAYLRAAGASVWIGVGVACILTAASGSAIRFEESLLGVSTNPLNFERAFVRVFGREYFRYKWFLLGAWFIAMGVMSLRR